MDDIRRLAFEHVGALNVNNAYRATIAQAEAESLGVWDQVRVESLKIRSHTGDILATRELGGIRDAAVSVRRSAP